MPKRNPVYLILGLAFAAWAILLAAHSCGPVFAREGYGRDSGSGATAASLYDFSAEITGSFTWTDMLENDAAETLAVGDDNLLMIRPHTSRGHNRVRVNWIKLTMESDVLTNRGQGARDSSQAFCWVQMVDYRLGLADSVYRDQNCVGSFIPRIAHAGFLTIPTVRMSSVLGSISSVERAYTNKELETLGSLPVWGDSVAFKFRPYQHSAMTGLTVWISYNATSYAAGSAGAPSDEWYPFIQYCDSSLASDDYVMYAGNARSCVVVGMALDTGPRHTIATNSTTLSTTYRVRADKDFDTNQNENNWRFFQWPYRPILTSADTMLMNTRTVKLRGMDWWDVATYPSIPSFKPTDFQGGANFSLHLDHQRNNGDLTNWSHTTGNLVGSSALDSSAGGVRWWRLTVGTDGTDQAPDTAFSKGAKAILSINPLQEGLGREDLTTGTHDNVTQTLNFGLFGGVVGTNVTYGIDCVGTGTDQKMQHFSQVRVSGPGTPYPVTSFPSGFALWMEKSQKTATTTGFRWREQVAVYGYSAGRPTLWVNHPTVGLLSPNGGESWTTGSWQYIQWSAGRETPKDYTIAISTDGGATYPGVIASGVWGGAQIYAWNVSSAYAGVNCKVRVTANYLGGSVSDTSDAVFTILSNPRVDSLVCLNDTVVNAGSPYNFSGCSATNAGLPGAGEENRLWAVTVGVQNTSYSLAYLPYFRFDLSAIPAGQTLDSVVVYLRMQNDAATLAEFSFTDSLEWCDAGDATSGNLPASNFNTWWNAIDKDRLGARSMSFYATQNTWYATPLRGDSLQKRIGGSLKLVAFPRAIQLCSGHTTSAGGTRIRRLFNTREDNSGTTPPYVKAYSH